MRSPTNALNEQTLNNSEVRADPVASKAPQTLKLGLDVHAETMVFVRSLDQSPPRPAQKFTPPKLLVLPVVLDVAGLAARFASLIHAG